MTRNVFVSIGNTDNRLDQADWVSFIEKVQDAIEDYAEEQHFNGYSEPTAWWQNCGWMFVVSKEHIPSLKATLQEKAVEFNQDSIYWLEGKGEFLTGVKVGGEA